MDLLPHNGEAGQASSVVAQRPQSCEAFVNVGECRYSLELGGAFLNASGLAGEMVAGSVVMGEADKTALDRRSYASGQWPSDGK